MFCRHKFGIVKSGYQYCKKCGKAIVVPCAHKWAEKYRIPYKKTAYGEVVQSGNLFLYECERCGETKEVIM